MASNHACLSFCSPFLSFSPRPRSGSQIILAFLWSLISELSGGRWSEQPLGPQWPLLKTGLPSPFFVEEELLDIRFAVFSFLQPKAKIKPDRFSAPRNQEKRRRVESSYRCSSKKKKDSTSHLNGLVGEVRFLRLLKLLRRIDLRGNPAFGYSPS